MSSKKKILVYSDFISPRLEYAAQLILGNILGQDYEISKDKSASHDESLILEYRAEQLYKDSFHIVPHGILEQNGTKSVEIDINTDQGIPFFFATNEGDFGFDIFALAFYLATRYEEYNSPFVDENNRYDVYQSLAYKSGFLDKPLIDIWALKLKAAMESHWTIALDTKNTYRYVPTIDIDQAWAYRNRHPHIFIGKWIKTFLTDWGEFKKLFEVFFRGKPDPFYSFDYLEELEKKYGFKHRFFILIGDLSKFDRNTPYRNKSYNKLLKYLSKSHILGLHPSYESNEDFDVLSMEKKRLEGYVKVTSSRQHFLKLSLPDTYKNLLKLGITDDFTMGYAQEIGFRASIARPYKWYDIDSEKVTELTIHPFQIMDGTFKQYLRMNKDEAVIAAKKIIDEVKNVDGEFSTIWHNSSFSHIENWHLYKGLYEEILKEGIAK